MQVSPELVADAPIPGSECWYRRLTNRDHVTRDGTVHYQALKGKQFRRPENKPWTHELSGGLRSRTPDICAEAEAEIERIRQNYVQQGRQCPSKICFMGVACATASELRAADLDPIVTDVVYSPLPMNGAHSNFITYETDSDEDLDPVRHWLMKTLRVIEPQDVEVQITSCGSPPVSAD
jgi:hypothetical protein